MNPSFLHETKVGILLEHFPVTNHFSNFDQLARGLRIVNLNVSGTNKKSCTRAAF